MAISGDQMRAMRIVRTAFSGDQMSSVRTGRPGAGVSLWRPDEDLVPPVGTKYQWLSLWRPDEEP